MEDCLLTYSVFITILLRVAKLATLYIFYIVFHCCWILTEKSKANWNTLFQRFVLVMNWNWFKVSSLENPILILSLLLLVHSLCSHSGITLLDCLSFRKHQESLIFIVDDVSAPWEEFTSRFNSETLSKYEILGDVGLTNHFKLDLEVWVGSVKGHLQWNGVVQFIIFCDESTLNKNWRVASFALGLNNNLSSLDIGTGNKL